MINFAPELALQPFFLSFLTFYYRIRRNNNTGEQKQDDDMVRRHVDIHGSYGEVVPDQIRKYRVIPVQGPEATGKAQEIAAGKEDYARGGRL
jgi:hypothetical protein